MLNALYALFNVTTTLRGGHYYLNLQMRKLRYREVKEITQGHTVGAGTHSGLMESQAPLYDSLCSVFVCGKVGFVL